MKPRYRTLYESGELHRRVDLLAGIYSNCTLCPHQCSVDRTAGVKGICGQGAEPVVASYNIHTGEEPPISGFNGSGTIFFSGCSGRCIYCQNYPISQFNTGNTVSVERLARMMLELQEKGCHNINFVTPTHFVPSIVSALVHAIRDGLQIPLVYNTSGYERVETLQLLDGIIDIYLPDAKYSDDDVANEISGFRDYLNCNHRALIEMFRQVGTLRTKKGLATTGLIIRHLILPENLSGTGDVMRFIADSVSPNVHISLMDQYFPAFHALKHKTLNRRVTQEEYDLALLSFEKSGLHKGWIQEHLTK